MSLATVFNKLGQTTMPGIAAKVFPDTMTIKAESASSIDTGGGRIKGTATDAYTNVPMTYEPVQTRKSDRRGLATQVVSIQQYLVRMPTHQSGSRINLDPKIHRFVVNTRGNEPVKTFRIISVGDVSGVVFEVVCEREG